jgi:hypothetical protein
MIFEKDVISILPPDCWLSQYVSYCSKQTTSPLAYHLGVGLTLLAVSASENYGMRFFGKMPCNLYCLLAGRSGEDQKSTALGLGEEILDAVNYKLIGDQPASAEGLIDSLASQSKQSLWYSEFGQFLSQSKTGYMESVKTTLTNLWDGKNVTRRKAGDTVIRATNPRLSIVAACSIPYLEQFTTPHDWTGGFMGRWLLMYSRRERTMPFPPRETTETIETRAWLISAMKKMSETKLDKNIYCKGLDDSAQKLWSEWYNELQSRDLPEMISGTQTRCPAIAIRIALIHAWDIGDSRRGKPWFITREVLHFAIEVAELHLRSVISLADRLIDHPDAKMRRLVLKQFTQKNSIMTLGEILKATKYRKRTILEVVDGLCLEGILSEIPTENNGGNKVFERNFT